MNKLLDLQLFNDGAAPGAAAPGEASQNAESNINIGSSSRNKTQNQVIYGKQADPEVEADPQEQPGITSDTAEDRRKEFERLISEDFKDLFTERTQGIIDRRFKETKALEAKVQSFDPIASLLMDRYGIKDGDFNKLAQAIESDDSYWEEAADEAGLTVEQYKHIKKMERENQKFREFQQATEREKQLQSSWQAILNQADETKALYPNFDLEQAFEDQHFMALIRSGVPVQTAYEVINIDTIKQGTAQTAEKRVINNIQKKSQRPTENGTSNTTGITIKNDVTKLTKADREEIARRVARGENISY